MKLPLLLSVPHAGLKIPPDVRPYCRLNVDQIVKDGDEGAAEIYDLSSEVSAFVTTDIARAIVDVNRARDDRQVDGVVKKTTCWDELVYDPFPPPEVIQRLLDHYYEPYHDQLRSAYTDQIRLAIDCHTMAAVGPPVSPDPGRRRPTVCLGDAHATALPRTWRDALAECFGQAFEDEVAINVPFSGGFITRTHGREKPWVQLEISRCARLTNREKRDGVLKALTAFCNQGFCSQ